MTKGELIEMLKDVPDEWDIKVRDWEYMSDDPIELVEKVEGQSGPYILIKG